MTKVKNMHVCLIQLDGYYAEPCLEILIFQVYNKQSNCYKEKWHLSKSSSSRRVTCDINFFLTSF